MPRKKKPLLLLWCEICGNAVPHNPGHPAKTCGAACHAERIKRKGAAYYLKIKGTESWKDARAEYLEKLKKAMQDPEFASIQRAHHAATMARWKARIDADPVNRAEFLAQKRAFAAAWRVELMNDPEAFERHKAEARAWYAALTAEERDRIYYEPRRTRAVIK